MISLYPPQQVSADTLANSIRAHGSALCGSAVGTGKTYVALDVCRQLQQKPLIICPKAVRTAWERACEAIGVTPTGIINYEKLRMGTTPWLLKGKMKKSFVWNLPKGSLLIFDEAHMCKGHDSLNSKMLATARSQGLRCLMLSATPFQDPTDLKAIGYALGLHNYTDYFQWCLKWGCRRNQWNQLEFPKNQADRLIDLAKQIYPGRGHFLTRSDLGDHFAECQIDWTPLDFDADAIAKAYDSVADELDELAARIEADGDDTIHLVELLRARQKVELLKVPVIADIANEYLDAGFSVFVAVNFAASLTALGDRLPGAVFIHGEQKPKDRQPAIDAFQNGSAKVCIANIKAGGVGISLHDTVGGAPRVSLISPSFSAIDLQQALGRVDRAGSKSDVLQRVLVAGGTIEEKICQALRHKLEKMQLTQTFGEAKSLNTKPIIKQPEAVTIQMSETASTPAIPAAQSSGNGHARFSPSQLKHFAKCPGYGPNDTENEAAIIGTRIHEALETDDFTKLQSEWEHWMANQCQQSIHGIIRRHKLTAFEDHREVRLSIRAGTASTYGTCDRLFIQGTTAVAADYKTGKGSIDDAESNWQAFAYAAGVLQKFPHLSVVHFYFIVPQRDEVSYGKFTRAMLPDLLKRIETVLNDAALAHTFWGRGTAPPPEMLHQDAGNCRFCKFVGECPKNGALARNIARAYQSDIEIPEVIHGSDNSNPDEISAMMKIVPIVEAWAAGVKKKARFLAIDQGVELPGFEVATRQGKRSITSATVAYQVASAHGVSVDAFIGAINAVPVGDYEDLIASVAPKGRKQALVAEVMSELFSHGALKHSEESFVLTAKK